MSSPQEILREMAQLTMLTGRISDVHYKNMKNFPFIFFNGVTQAEIDYNIATNKDDDSLVIYKITLDADQNDNTDYRFRSLEAAIRTLFWKEMMVSIEINGEPRFLSEIVKKPKKKDEPCPKT